MKTSMKYFFIAGFLACAAVFAAFTDTAGTSQPYLCGLSKSADPKFNYVLFTKDLAGLDSLCIDGPVQVLKFNIVIMPKLGYMEMMYHSQNKFSAPVISFMSRLKPGDMAVLDGIKV